MASKYFESENVDMKHECFTIYNLMTMTAITYIYFKLSIIFNLFYDSIINIL